MRRILFVLMSTVAVVVMLFGYRTSTPHPPLTGPTVVAAGGTDSGSGTAAVPAAPQSAGSSGSTGTTTVTGQSVQTRWGPVQVQITVSGKQITAVSVLQVPSSNGRDVQINSYAVPVLKQETLQAQGAGIDSVSGATVTSNGYVSSLQSALDQADL